MMLDTPLLADFHPVGTLSVFSGNCLHFGPGPAPGWDPLDQFQGRYVFFGQIRRHSPHPVVEEPASRHHSLQTTSYVPDTQITPITACLRTNFHHRRSPFRTSLVKKMVHDLRMFDDLQAQQALEGYIESMTERINLLKVCHDDSEDPSTDSVNSDAD